MKIALIAPYFYPVNGGREQTVLALAEGLSKKGHSVTVITSDLTPEGKKVKPENDNFGFTVRRIRSIFFVFRFEIPLKITGLSGYDIVHIISTDDIFTFLYLISAKIRKKRVFVTIFTPFALLKHPRKILRPFLSFFELISIPAIYLADTIQVKNRIDLDIIKKFTIKANLIPDGISDKYFTCKPDLDFREKHGLKDNKIILFVNRIHPLKGPQLLVKAMNEILKDQPGAVAVIMGPDPEGFTPELKKMAEDLSLLDHVIFPGFVSEEEKIAAYDAADVVVIPSVGEFTEGFSIVLSEAWARGKTVVVTPSRALRSRVVPGKGYVSGYDPESLADSIKQGLQQPVIPPAVPTWEEVVDMIEKEYLKIREP